MKASGPSTCEAQGPANWRISNALVYIARDVRFSFFTTRESFMLLLYLVYKSSGRLPSHMFSSFQPFLQLGEMFLLSSF
jgi:hypothetical protein